MKCVVLFGGKGSRVSHLSNNSNKAFIEINNKPIVYYVIGNLLKSFKKEDLILITSFEHKEHLINIVKSFFGIEMKIICQQKPTGVPDAIYLSKDFVSDKFAVCLGDFYSEEIPNIISYSLTHNENQITTNRVSNPKDYGILVNEKIIEKPKDDVGNLAVRGFYIFKKEVLSLIPSLLPSKRNETEISDLLNKIKFNSFEILNVYDLGSEKGILSFKN